MPRKPLDTIEEHFSKVNDPRVDRTKEHKLIDMIVIAICAVIVEQKAGRISRILGTANCLG